MFFIAWSWKSNWGEKEMKKRQTHRNMSSRAGMEWAMLALMHSTNYASTVNLSTFVMYRRMGYQVWVRFSVGEKPQVAVIQETEVAVASFYIHWSIICKYLNQRRALPCL